jgi:predicted nucleic acid-binding Zn ribbon protein
MVKSLRSPRRRRKQVKEQEAVFSGSGKSARDPVRLGDAVTAAASKQGWGGALVEGAITTEWALIVGPEIADHVTIEAYLPRTKELVLLADSPAWATQVRLLQRQVLAKIAQQVGLGAVTRISIRSRTGAERRDFPKARRSTPR